MILGGNTFLYPLSQAATELNDARNEIVATARSFGDVALGED